MDFTHISGQKEAIWNTVFSIFERRRGPKRRGARENSRALSLPLDRPEGGSEAGLSASLHLGLSLRIALQQVSLPALSAGRRDSPQNTLHRQSMKPSDPQPQGRLVCLPLDTRVH